MATYYTDFNDPRKRKHIFEHVANDLISAGFSVDSKIVQNKWKGLLRSYTKAKDTKNRTGQGPSRFLFYEIIDDIVGNQPKNSCHHSLNSLDTTVLADTGIEEPNLELKERNDKSHGEMGELPEVEAVGTEEEKNPSEELINSNKRRKRVSEKQLKKEYIDLKREEYTRRQKRHAEKYLMEQERNEIERKKLTVLEEYLKNN
ncbi:hypothetical protein JTB14_036427 [Gonioctena quinquepunctata]|nr:hypothetical protein JTB14_036427 [Gonioctena quinquepunctata]